MTSALLLLRQRGASVVHKKKTIVHSLENTTADVDLSVHTPRRCNENSRGSSLADFLFFIPAALV
jgi:hypothetical protein